MSEKSKGVALILTSFPGLGFLGFDKLYAGNYTLFWIQFILTISIIGTAFTIPFTIVCNIVLLFAILFGSSVIFYPNTIWKKTSFDDRVIAWSILIIYIYIFIAALLFLSFKDINFWQNFSFIL